MIGLLGATLRVSVILLVALGLAWLLRRRTASLRHAVLLIAMACAALVPVATALMPAWASRDIVVPATLRLLPAAEHPSAQRGPTVPASTPRTAGINSPKTNVLNASAPTRTHAWSTKLLPFLGGVYIAGVVMSLLTLAVGLLHLARIAARSRPMRAQAWQRQAALIANACGLRRSVQLLCSPYPAVLATWGIRRPQVLLPSGASEWPEDRIRAVLLHEFAHVRRNDWLIQLLALVVRAVYWFNPLVWIACARLRQESEQASDDAAVEQGVRPTEYAAHLLALARSFTCESMRLPAPSMARRSTLRRRIASILDPATRRARPARMSIARIAVALLVVTWVVTACEVARPPVRIADTRTQQPVPTSVAGPESSLSTLAAPAAAIRRDPRGNPIAPKRIAVTTPHPATDVDPVSVPELTDSPQAIAGDIIDFAQSAVAGDWLDQLTGNNSLRGRMNDVLRIAQGMAEARSGDAALVAAKGAALLGALGDAANSASNVATRRGTSWSNRQALQLFAVEVHAKSAQLSDAILPVHAVTSLLVSTPERRAAIAVLDLAQTARADPLLGGPRPHVSLLAGLDTVERAAQSILTGDDKDLSGTAKVTALSAAILMTARVAANISSRDVEPMEARSRARNLTVSLHAAANQLGFAAPSEDDTRWMGWALPIEISTATDAGFSADP